MSLDAPVRSVPYGGYFLNRPVVEDAELTHVGPGMPGGNYLRRFWHPVALSSELTDLPLPVRILGEDLVLFRDLSGRVGLLHRHCSHRGTSLEFGIVATRGIRCCYHGWLFDIDGTVLETPGEPPQSRVKDRLFHGAYPAREYKGLVFAYLGPPEDKPEFPVYDITETQGDELLPYSVAIPCNWLQVHENSMDPIHTVFLHTRVTGTQLSDAWGALPVIDWQERPGGMIYITTRRWGDFIWVRSTDVFMPNMAQAAALWEDGSTVQYFNRVSITRWMTPIDDIHSMTIGWRHFNDRVDPKGLGKRSEVGKERVDFIGQTAERTFEERQRVPGDYDAEVGQGPIAIHAREHMGSTDRGVAMLRQLLRRAIRATAKGDKPSLALCGPRGIIPTYAHDTVLKIPARPGADEQAQLRELGLRVTEIVRAVGFDAGPARQGMVEAAVKDLERQYQAGETS
ncbi:MAG: Rieske 2Fe-2S domain-containing protein [Pseudomonadota bacterium]